MEKSHDSASHSVARHVTASPLRARIRILPLKWAIYFTLLYADPQTASREEHGHARALHSTHLFQPARNSLPLVNLLLSVKTVRRDVQMYMWRNFCLEAVLETLLSVTMHSYQSVPCTNTETGGRCHFDDFCSCCSLGGFELSEEEDKQHHLVCFLVLCGICSSKHRRSPWS